MSQPSVRITPLQVALLAVSAAIGVGNLYYMQPLFPEIAKSLGVPPRGIGSVAMFIQLGYASGLLLFVPLGDIMGRRVLITRLCGLTAVALLAVALAPGLVALTGACALLGAATVIPQVAIPFAAHLAPPDSRGRVMGVVLGALLVGILAARAIGGFVGGVIGWRSLYVAACVAVVGLGAALRALLPEVLPESSFTYRGLLASLWPMWWREPIVRQAALTGAATFGAFSAFWTTLGFHLQRPPLSLGTGAAGGFAVIGAAGSIAAVLGGRWTDRSSPRRVVTVGIASAVAGYAILFGGRASLAGLAIGLLLLDLGVQFSHVGSLARIHALQPAARNRLQTLYMVSYFVGGAGGSALGAYVWEAAGWGGVCALGAAFAVAGAAGIYPRYAESNPEPAIVSHP